MRHMTVFIILAVLMPSVSLADTHQTVQELTTQCTTKATGIDGVRHWCDAAPDLLRAPTGHVLVERSLRGGEVRGNGSVSDCFADFADFVEVIPDTGIMQPTTLKIYGHARGPGGYSSGRGWVECRYTVTVVRLDQ